MDKTLAMHRTIPDVAAAASCFECVPLCACRFEPAAWSCYASKHACTWGTEAERVDVCCEHARLCPRLRRATVLVARSRRRRSPWPRRGSDRCRSTISAATLLTTRARRSDAWTLCRTASTSTVRAPTRGTCMQTCSPKTTCSTAWMRACTTA
eukprot:603478-Pleurochrysis_carterae.AAC.2